MTDARAAGSPWHDRTVVVTGGTSGIGRQFAIRFAAEGAKVLVCGRNDMTLGKLRAEHPKVEIVQCDVTVRPDVLALVETIRDRYGKVDVLVNNASIIERVIFRTSSRKRIRTQLKINHLARCAPPALGMERRSCAIGRP